MPFIPNQPAEEVFAPTDGGGSPRGAVMGEAQTWGMSVEAWMDSRVSSATDYGIVSDSTDGTDGTDQTAEMVSVINTLGAANFRGILRVPYNTKYDLATVYAAVDGVPGLVLEDDSVINWHSTPTYKQRIKLWYSGDLEDDDFQVGVGSGHHAAISINNFGTSGTAASDQRMSSILFGGGLDPNKDQVVGFMQQQSDRGTDSQWYMQWRLQHTWEYATRLIIWEAGLAVPANRAIFELSTGRVYRSVNSGNLGSTPPSHTAGTVTNGTVDLTFERAALNVDKTVFQFSQRGEMTLVGETAGSVTFTMAAGARQLTMKADEAANNASIAVNGNRPLLLGGTDMPSATTPGIFAWKYGASNYQLWASSSGATDIPMIVSRVSGDNGTLVRFYGGNILGARIEQTGAGVIQFTSSSDYRIKQDVREIDADEAISRIRAYRPKRFRLDGGRHEQTGYIAHEVQVARPDAVVGEKDAVEDLGVAVTPARTVEDDAGQLVDIPEQRREAVRRSDCRPGETFEPSGETVPVLQTMDKTAPVADVHAALLVALDRIDALAAQIKALKAA